VVRDVGFLSAETSTAVMVVDTAPPESFRATAEPTCLWPPNSSWAQFQLGSSLLVEATDLCGGPVAIDVDSVTVTEDGVSRLGSASDVLLSGNDVVCLRAHRTGTSS